MLPIFLLGLTATTAMANPFPNNANPLLPRAQQCKEGQFTGPSGCQYTTYCNTIATGPSYLKNGTAATFNDCIIECDNNDSCLGANYVAGKTKVCQLLGGFSGQATKTGYSFASQNPCG